MAVTLKTISEKVGISQAAVSMILNRRPGDLSSEETKKKVFAIARELNYKQKFGHKVLRGDRTHSVAILYAMHRLLMEEQIQQLVLLLQNKFSDRGYISSLLPSAGDEGENVKLVKELIQRGIDHFIFIGCPFGYNKIEEVILAEKRSVIGFSSLFKNNISNDIAYAIRETIRNFMADGRNNFRLMVGRKPQYTRIKALCSLFPDQPEEQVVDKHMVFSNFSGEINNIDELTSMGYEATRKMMEEDPEISAIMYISDFQMLGGVRYFYEKNYEIGKDVKLCGVNNIHAVRNHLLPLMTWEIDMQKISDLLICGCEKNMEINVLIKPEFIERNQP